MNKKKLTNLYLKQQKIQSKSSSINTKLSKFYEKYLKQIDNVFIPLIKQSNSNPQIQWKVSSLSQKPIYCLQCIKLIPNTNSYELILDISIYNLKTPNKINIKDIKLNSYKTSNNFEWELEKNILIGEISKYFIKNQSKILSKINNSLTFYFNKLELLFPTTQKYHELTSRVANEIIDYHTPYFLEYLKQGILIESISPKHPLHDILGEGEIAKVTKIKLLENNELLVTGLKDVNSDISETHIIKEFNVKKRFPFLLDHHCVRTYKFPEIYSEVIQSYDERK